MRSGLTLIAWQGKKIWNTVWSLSNWFYFMFHQVKESLYFRWSKDRERDRLISANKVPIIEHFAALLNISILILTLFLVHLLFGLGKYHRCGKVAKFFLAFQLPHFEEYIRKMFKFQPHVKQYRSKMYVREWLKSFVISARRSLITFVFLAYLQSIFSSRISTKDWHIGGRTGIVNLKKFSGPFGEDRTEALKTERTKTGPDRLTALVITKFLSQNSLKSSF